MDSRTSAPPILIQAPAKKKKSMLDRFNAKLHPHIPHCPFFCGIVGPRGSGKSNLLLQLLDPKNKGFYGASFKPKNMIVYKPTKDFDPTFEDLDLHHYFGPEVNVAELIAEAERQQKQHKKDENMLPVLLVLDDITQIQDAWTILERLGYIGRHFGMQILFVVHKISSCPRGIRTQCQQWVIFKPHEQSEWDWVLDTFASRKTKEIWLVALNRAWNIPYNFIYIDFERDGDDVYHSGFSEPLFTPDEMELMRPDLQSLLSKRQLERLGHIQTPAALDDPEPLPPALEDKEQEAETQLKARGLGRVQEEQDRLKRARPQELDEDPEEEKQRKKPRKPYARKRFITP